MCWRERIELSNDFGFRNADCGLRRGTMKRIWIGYFAGTILKSALCNLKSAILMGAIFFALCFSAQAQQPTKVPRIGYLTNTSLSAGAANIESFRQGLR